MGFTEFSLKIEIQTHESDWQNGFSKSNGCDHCIGRSALCRLWAISASAMKSGAGNFSEWVLKSRLWYTCMAPLCQCLGLYSSGWCFMHASLSASHLILHISSSSAHFKHTPAALEPFWGLVVTFWNPSDALLWSFWCPSGALLEPFWSSFSMDASFFLTLSLSMRCSAVANLAQNRNQQASASTRLVAAAAAAAAAATATTTSRQWPPSSSSSSSRGSRGACGAQLSFHLLSFSLSMTLCSMHHLCILMVLSLPHGMLMCSLRTFLQYMQPPCFLIAEIIMTCSCSCTC